MCTHACMCYRGAASTGGIGPTAGQDGTSASPAEADGTGQRLPADHSEEGATQPDKAARYLPDTG